jgi:sugar O-acyltransferase (sialic acid O-acetyltransferase NeuD family)
MTRYRSTEHGVERIEGGRSTFIPADPTNAAWRDFLAWSALGHVHGPRAPRPYSFDAGATKKLWIVGAGGFGREVFSMTHSARGADVAWRVAGFLNDIKDSLDGFEGYPAIAGGTDYEPQHGDAFICAIGDVHGRRMVCEKFRARGAEFINVISEGARISGAAQLGAGLIVEAFTGIAANARIGDFTTILGHSTIGHDVHIGRYSQISPYCDIHGWAQIGEGCLIGSHAVILTKVKIGHGATVGAGSVVLKDVPPGATVFGVPAVRVK